MAGLERKNLHLLIMAGGSGTRFWPKSRSNKPKQLLALWDDKTLLEHTLDRFQDVVPTQNRWIVTTQQLEKPSKQVLSQRFPETNYLLEPFGKNTAPCIFWGIQKIRAVDPSAVIAVMPADHYIANEKVFQDAVLKACSFAEREGGLVTMGIKPNRPETGFGYIEIQTGMPNDLRTAQPGPVKQFVEKPDLRTAHRYVESGRYLWNAGMFFFTAEQGYQAFQKCMPSLVELFERGEAIEKTYGAISKVDATSIDFGVMEMAPSKGIPVWVLPVDCGWNDVGSFPALEDIEIKNPSEKISLDANCNVTVTDKGVIALLGVNELVVVRDGDIVLVCAKDRAQDIKLLLEKVKVRFPEQL